MIKRVFDIIIAATGLVVLSPIMMVVAVLVKCDSQGPVLFKQKRMGKGFRAFLIYKFRTMKENSELIGRPITIGEDPRITRVGRFLRKTKIDELPQLLNVLKGEMSLVGPRPELPRFVELFRREYAEILTMRPGITDLASLKYQDEANLMGQFTNPEEEYVRRILPDKIRLAKEYIDRSSIFFDLSLILRTLPKLFGFTHSRIDICGVSHNDQQ
ncbi:MAG TPA: sugar transferase [Candidatus Binatia bacterium]|nr:sugar transferase [Candidatus Binatia bacterium]